MYGNDPEFGGALFLAFVLCVLVAGIVEWMAERGRNRRG